MDSRAATEGGPYECWVGAALRGGPTGASPKRGLAVFCRSTYAVRGFAGQLAPSPVLPVRCFRLSEA